jgi:hypothetical protein
MDSLPYLIFNKIIGYYQGSIKQMFEIAKILGHEKTIDPSYTDYMNKIGEMIKLYEFSENFEFQNSQYHNIIPNLPIISNRDDYLNLHGISNNQFSEIKSLTNYINVVGSQTSKFEWGTGLDLIEGIWIDCWGDYFSSNCEIKLYLVDSDKPIYRHRDIPLCFHSRRNKVSSEFQLFSDITPFIMKPRHHHFIKIQIDNRSGQNINNIRIRIDYRSILNNDNVYQVTNNLQTLWHQSLRLKSYKSVNDIIFTGSPDFSYDLCRLWTNNGGYYGLMIYSPVPLINNINLSLGQTIDISFDSSFINTLARLYNMPQLPNMFCYPIIFSDNPYHNMCMNKSDFGTEIFKKIKVSGFFSHPPNQPILFYEMVLNYDLVE